MLGHASCSFIIICLAAHTEGINTTVSLHLSFSPMLISALIYSASPFISFPKLYSISLSRTPHFPLMLIYFLWFSWHCFPPSIFIIAPSLPICAEELKYWGCYLPGRDGRDLAYTGLDKGCMR